MSTNVETEYITRLYRCPERHDWTVRYPATGESTVFPPSRFKITCPLHRDSDPFSTVVWSDTTTVNGYWG